MSLSRPALLLLVLATLSCRSASAPRQEDDPRYLCRVDVAPLREALRASGGDRFVVTGDLTIKDVTKSVDLDVELTGTAKDPFGNERLGLEGSVVVNRKDWGLTWNALLEAGGLLVSEKVTLEFDVSAIKQAA